MCLRILHNMQCDILRENTKARKIIPRKEQKEHASQIVEGSLFVTADLCKRKKSSIGEIFTCVT